MATAMVAAEASVFEQLFAPFPILGYLYSAYMRVCVRFSIYHPIYSIPPFPFGMRINYLVFAHRDIIPYCEMKRHMDFV